MSARSHHNVYRTKPAGTDYQDVLNRAKRFFRTDKKFRILPGKVFLATNYSDIYYSKGQRVYEFVDGRWTEIVNGFWNEQGA